jgi:hypothetical protein
VPGDLRLLAGPVEPPRSSPSPSEFTAEVRILLWDQKTGNNMHGVQSDQFRGKVLDFPSVTMKPAGRPVPLSTGCLLVDVAGGDPLSPKDKDKVHSPGSILMLDETGNLVIHDEMVETKEWTAATKEPDKPRTGGGIAPGRGGGAEGRRTVPITPPRHPGGPADSSLPDMN